MYSEFAMNLIQLVEYILVHSALIYVFEFKLYYDFYYFVDSSSDKDLPYSSRLLSKRHLLVI